MGDPRNKSSKGIITHQWPGLHQSSRLTWTDSLTHWLTHITSWASGDAKSECSTKWICKSGVGHTELLRGSHPKSWSPKTSKWAREQQRKPPSQEQKELVAKPMWFFLLSTFTNYNDPFHFLIFLFVYELNIILWHFYMAQLTDSIANILLTCSKKMAQNGTRAEKA